MTNSPHDALFRFTFSQPEHAISLLRTVLPPDVVAAIDWSTLRLCPGTQIDPRLRRQQSDLLFSARAGGREVLIYILIEHKSRNDRWTALQVLGYVVGVWKSLRRQRPRPRRLPPIIPVVFHQGPRGWTASTDIAGLLDLEALPAGVASTLAAMQPQFRFLLKSYADCAPEELRALTLTLLGKVTLASLQYLPRATAAEVLTGVASWADMVRGVLRAPSGAEAIAALSAYVLKTTPVDPEVLIEVTGRVVEHEASMIMKTAASRLRAEGKLEGKAEGKAEGMAAGEVAGRAELLGRMLAARFGIVPKPVRARLATATSAELDRWAIRCLDSKSLAQVFAED